MSIDKKARIIFWLTWNVTLPRFDLESDGVFFFSFHFFLALISFWINLEHLKFLDYRKP